MGDILVYVVEGVAGTTCSVRPICSLTSAAVKYTPTFAIQRAQALQEWLTAKIALPLEMSVNSVES